MDGDEFILFEIDDKKTTETVQNKTLHMPRGLKYSFGKVGVPEYIEMYLLIDIDICKWKFRFY